jgi:hypothetical protein
MTCPRNQFGQPACFIVAHPDHPNDSFCLTCGRRFSPPTQPSTTSKNYELLVLAISVLMLVLLLKVILFQPNEGSLPDYDFPYHYRDMTEI